VAPLDLYAPHRDALFGRGHTAEPHQSRGAGPSAHLVFDCPGGRRAALTGDAPLEGELDWEQLPATDETLLVACKAGPAQG
jgi:hypothetical protein